MEPSSYSPPPAPQPAPSGPRKSSGYALASLILGIFSVVGGVLLFIPAVLAIVFGHVSVSQCEKNPALDGKGLGIAGLVLGYCSFVFGIPMIGLVAAMAIPAFQKVRTNSQDKAILNNARQISAAADQYYLENGVSVVRYTDIVGPDKFVRTFHTVAGEKYPERYTMGVTLTIQGVAGARTVTYEP